ncbi:hypothetical protein QYE80_11965 [Pseudomonas tohonis]|nr:hypothetical protein [Pseudomonas tohonis]
MRTVSFQGTALNPSQRRALEQHRAIARSFVSPHLERQIQQAQQNLDRYQRETWFFDRYETEQLLAALRRHSTFSIAEMAGYTLDPEYAA